MFSAFFKLKQFQAIKSIATFLITRFTVFDLLYFGFHSIKIEKQLIINSLIAYLSRGLLGGGGTPVPPLDMHPQATPRHTCPHPPRDNLPRILEFGGIIIKASSYFLLILRPYHLNGMLFLTRFLMVENSCMFP